MSDAILAYMLSLQDWNDNLTIGTWLGFLRSVVIYHNPVNSAPIRRLYRNLLKEENLVFDIGAHVGTRARAMRAAGARVIALEPQAPFSTYLRWTLPRDIRLIEAAAGRSESIAQMAVSSRHPTVSSLKTGFVEAASATPGFEKVKWDMIQNVRVTTLDALIAEEGVPRYIKIDVEGFELDVLAGLSHPVEIISVEYLPGLPDLTIAVIDRLMELGQYRFNPVRGEEGDFLWDQWSDAETVKRWLRSLAAHEKSGDLYARLPDPT
ncbi:FkbM family methyltransferase [Roseicitreum antarcticum]|uniref:Methyltransferase, FkbM family n=1 Tax=Roseicitreum antarcticum TaxID=564137 RepID=A0A1H2THP4_9RHOB|nr:FkbM family methyltransferase [Roseicitreum antarcticum]SDW43185.1 methyltransferase, FkbM family [Roseicitreum antarcticum]